MPFFPPIHLPDGGGGGGGAATAAAAAPDGSGGGGGAATAAAAANCAWRGAGKGRFALTDGNQFLIDGVMPLSGLAFFIFAITMLG